MFKICLYEIKDDVIYHGKIEIYKTTDGGIEAYPKFVKQIPTFLYSYLKYKKKIISKDEIIRIVGAGIVNGKILLNESRTVIYAFSRKEHDGKLVENVMDLIRSSFPGYSLYMTGVKRMTPLLCTDNPEEMVIMHRLFGKEAYLQHCKIVEKMGDEAEFLPYPSIAIRELVSMLLLDPEKIKIELAAAKTYVEKEMVIRRYITGQLDRETVVNFIAFIENFDGVISDNFKKIQQLVISIYG